MLNSKKKRKKKKEKEKKVCGCGCGALRGRQRGARALRFALADGPDGMAADLVNPPRMFTLFIKGPTWYLC
jgi:hypothetical protein